MTAIADNNDEPIIMLNNTQESENKTEDSNKPNVSTIMEESSLKGRRSNLGTVHDKQSFEKEKESDKRKDMILKSCIICNGHGYLIPPFGLEVRSECFNCCATGTRPLNKPFSNKGMFQICNPKI